MLGTVQVGEGNGSTTLLLYEPAGRKKASSMRPILTFPSEMLYFPRNKIDIGISPPKNYISPETIDIYPNKIGIDSNVFEICRRVGKALTSLGRHLPSDTIIRFF